MANEKFYIKKQEYTNRTLRFPVEIVDALNKLAAREKTSLNQVVVQCCEYALENLREEE